MTSVAAQGYNASLDTLLAGGAAGTYWDGSSLSYTTPAGGGSGVSSVATGLGLTGGPITGSGTVACTGKLGDIAALSTMGFGDGFYFDGTNVKNYPLPMYNAIFYGADKTGTSSSSTAIGNAISAVATAGGGTIFFPDGNYKLTSTALINTHNIKLLGNGSEGNHQSGTTTYTTRFFSGTSGMTMIKFESPNTSGVITNQKCVGGGMSGITIDGNYGSGTQAAIGLQLRSRDTGTYEDLFILECSSRCLLLDTLDPPGAGAFDAPDTQQNYFRNITFRQLNSDAPCIFLGTNSTRGANASINRFVNIKINFGGATAAAIDNNAGDTNKFDQIFVFCTSSTLKGIVNRAAPSGAIVGDNVYTHVTCNGKIICEGTPSNTIPSQNNTFHDLDYSNGTLPPTIEAGATCQWDMRDGTYGGVMREFKAVSGMVGKYTTTSGTDCYVELTNGIKTWNYGIAGAGEFHAYNAVTGLFGLLIHPTTNAVTMPGVNSNTTASAANVNVDASGVMKKSTSSLRYKENVKPYEKGLQAVMALNPIEFTGIGESKVNCGVAAENVADVGLEELLDRDEQGRPNAVAYPHLTALLINAVKELSAKVEKLESRV